VSAKPKPKAVSTRVSAKPKEVSKRVSAKPKPKAVSTRVSAKPKLDPLSMKIVNDFFNEYKMYHVKNNMSADALKDYREIIRKKNELGGLKKDCKMNPHACLSGIVSDIGIFLEKYKNTKLMKGGDWRRSLFTNTNTNTKDVKYTELSKDENVTKICNYYLEKKTEFDEIFRLIKPSNKELISKTIINTIHMRTDQNLLFNTGSYVLNEKLNDLFNKKLDIPDKKQIRFIRNTYALIIKLFLRDEKTFMSKAVSTRRDNIQNGKITSRNKNTNNCEINLQNYISTRLASKNLQ